MSHEIDVGHALAELRRKIARWHIALQQRHVDRDWPALEIIMQEMASESHIGNGGTEEPRHVDTAKLVDLCQRFIDENTISCAETIYQTDRVIENAYDFIKQICDIVGYCEYGDEEEPTP